MNILSNFPEPDRNTTPKNYLIAIGLISIALALRLLIWPVEAGLQYVTFFPAVALTAVFAGFWPGMLVTVIGVLLATTIFTHPYMSFTVEVLRNSLWSNMVFSLDGFVVCLSIEAMHRFRQRYAKELEETYVAHAESEQMRQQVMAIVDNVMDGIITIDQRGRMQSFNRAASKIFGYDEREVIGQNVAMLMPEPNHSKHDQYLQNYLRTGVKKVIGVGREVEAMREDGSIFPLEISITEIKGKELMFCGVVRDISERKAREKHMFHLAHHDQLTGLPNRMLLLDRLDQLLIKARRDKSKLSVMFVDLDEFKEINDTLGHDIGDLLLKAVTTRILDCLRESDTAARIGGDEFIVVLPSLKSKEAALLVAEKIRRSLSQPFRVSGKTLAISSSIGVALYPDHGLDDSDLIKHADHAMYKAKGFGRNQVALYSSADQGS